MGRKGWGMVSVIGACAFVGTVLFGCSQQQAAHNASDKVSVEQQQQLLRKKQLAAAAAQLKQTQAKIAADNKAIPILLAQSDVALKQSQAFKGQAAKLKPGKGRQPLDDKAAQAQKLADSRAEQLVLTRQDLYVQLAAASDLQKQVKGLQAKNQPAEKVASSKNRAGGEKGKNSRSSRVARQGKGSQM